MVTTVSIALLTQSLLHLRVIHLAAMSNKVLPTPAQRSATTPPANESVVQQGEQAVQELALEDGARQ
jgi:hypothetical protein